MSTLSAYIIIIVAEIGSKSVPMPIGRPAFALITCDELSHHHGLLKKFLYRNHKFQIFTAHTKAKSQAYSQALNQSKIDRQRVNIQKIRQPDSQTAIRWVVFRVEKAREVGRRGGLEDKIY